ncbi:FAD/NAD(P)-binding protein [Luteimonas sp. BDR2-5]|uniref:FAD/NAD(P)-binding protein n=1 Tax=Proluteimonas luteida TaxID=2878685 RepID=UPI001E513431|nr:FAD/NAD(P)-binding protein [Luteimonas sp. BDR2-5]
MPSSSTSARLDVAIVGAGACGALVAWHLLGRDAADDGALRVALVEPRAALAQGVAYSTPRAEHILNVNAARMSAFDTRPDDFLQYLAAQPEAGGQEIDALAGVFAPRRVYGRYLAQRLATRAAAAAPERRTDAAVDIRPEAGGYALSLASGAALHARAVVLALGNLPAALPLPPGAVAPAGVVEAWDHAAVAAIDPGDEVCIVGAGLSMVDVVLTLHANGHRGRITAVSRHGLMPLAHAPGTLPQAGGIDALLPLGVHARMRMLRRWAAEAVAAGRPWQDAMERLRPQVQALWTSLPADEQRRFLRHAVRYWDIHRHRIAPEAAAVLAELQAAGRFTLRAGHLHAVEAGPPLQVRVRARGTGRVDTLAVDRLVNATGMHKALRGAPDPLLPALQARGLVRAGPHGLGVDTTVDGQLRGADGVPVPGLWTLGALRIGSLWESIAMPELRGQAARVAACARAYVAR